MDRGRPPSRPLPHPLSRACHRPPPRTGEGRHHAAPKTAETPEALFWGWGRPLPLGVGDGGTRGGGSGRGRTGVDGGKARVWWSAPTLHSPSMKKALLATAFLEGLSVLIVEIAGAR